MFGPRLTTIFASRWKALWWAGGILVLAWQLVPEPEQAPTASAPAPAPAHNPWARDSAASSGK
ncbi:MAG TPA: hypothetical protein EYH41_08995 [Novosphingobium capsulatum]|nr:hypothetical protein [Novosphingobium aromaticivorans]HIQ18112.1 hypothetical protein [Novosphingobium capsulatum]